MVNRQPGKNWRQLTAGIFHLTVAASAAVVYRD